MRQFGNGYKLEQIPHSVVVAVRIKYGRRSIFPALDYQFIIVHLRVRNVAGKMKILWVSMLHTGCISAVYKISSMTNISCGMFNKPRSAHI